MTDAVPSDHDAVDSHRVHLDAVGSTSRLQLPLPEAVECTESDVVSLSLETDSYHAQVEEQLDGTPVVRGAYLTRADAREQSGTNELGAFLEAHGVDEGDPLILDVLTAGYAYGLRRPGERVVYNPPDAPDSSLADIASTVTDDDS